MGGIRRFLEEESEAEKKKRDFDPNVGGGVDREKLKDSDFVFSDERTCPVVTPGDVSDAVSSWGRYKGSKSFEVFKKRLIALCKRKGQGFFDALPKEWKDEMEGNMKEAQSLSKQLMEIEDAWRAKYAMGSMVQPSVDCWLMETYEDYVIAKMADKYFKVTYQMVEDEITFAERGEWEEVEGQKDWVAKAEGAKRQQRTHEFREGEGRRSVSEEGMGSIVSPKWDEKKKRLMGIFKVVEEALAKKLKNAWDQGVLGTIGLSIDTSPIESVAVHEGHQAPR